KVIGDDDEDIDEEIFVDDVRPKDRPKDQYGFFVGTFPPPYDVEKAAEEIDPKCFKQEGVAEHCASLYTKRINLGKIECDALVDTCSTLSTVSYDFCKRLGVSNKIYRPDTQTSIRSIGGPMPILGSITLSFVLDDYQFHQVFH